MNINEKAALVGVSVRTLRDYYGENPNLVNAEPSEIVAWRLANKHNTGGIKATKERAAAGGGTLQEQLLRAQIDKTEADAEARRLKNRQQAGELVEADDVQRVWSQACAKVRARLEIMPQEAAKDMPATREELIERLTLVVRGVLLDLSEIVIDGNGE